MKLQQDFTWRIWRPWYFAADIYYHNSCYIKFALKKIEQTVNETVELLENDILEQFVFFDAKEKNRTWKRCIFVERPIERYQTFNWTLWIDETCYSNTGTLKRIINNKFTDNNSLQVFSSTQQRC